MLFYSRVCEIELCAQSVKEYIRVLLVQVQANQPDFRLKSM